jgi:hypothetical protein
MAWIFALNAECGPSEATARELSRHFSPWPSGASRDSLSNWWCWVAPEGLSRTGIGSDEEAAAMTELGNKLYDRLRSAPALYRYALVGVETDQFRDFDELFQDTDLTVFPGLVLSDSVWSALGGPPEFVPFSPQYRWIPYTGERYQPG